MGSLRTAGILLRETLWRVLLEVLRVGVVVVVDVMSDDVLWVVSMGVEK